MLCITLLQFVNTQILNRSTFGYEITLRMHYPGAVVAFQFRQWPVDNMKGYLSLEIYLHSIFHLNIYRLLKTPQNWMKLKKNCFTQTLSKKIPIGWYKSCPSPYYHWCQAYIYDYFSKGLVYMSCKLFSWISSTTNMGPGFILWYNFTLNNLNCTLTFDCHSIIF